MNKRQHFPVKGMTCGNCVRHVETALKSLPGIAQLEVNLEKQEALVEFDSTVVTYETMASVLKDAGYIMDKSVD
ncbi:MAG: cation transporter [Nitrospirota bacterium]|nr:cation transporter [Nitrospirota bacterium]